MTGAIAVSANARAQPDHLGDQFLSRPVRKIVVHRHHQRWAASQILGNEAGIGAFVQPAWSSPRSLKATRQRRPGSPPRPQPHKVPQRPATVWVRN
jgi:hypothetical protein